MAEVWSVYVLRLGNGGLYTGVSTDVARRLGEHGSGGRAAAKSLCGKGPFELVWARAVGGRGRALRVESRIKRLNRAEKERLLADDALWRRLLADARRAQ